MKVEGCFDFYPDDKSGYYEDQYARGYSMVVIGFGLLQKEQPKIRIFLTAEQAIDLVNTINEALSVLGTDMVDDE